MSVYPWPLEEPFEFGAETKQMETTTGGVSPEDQARLNDRTRGENARVQQFLVDLQAELAKRGLAPEVIQDNTDEVVNGIVGRVQSRITSPAGQWLIAWGAIDNTVRDNAEPTDPMRLYISRLMGISYGNPEAEPKGEYAPPPPLAPGPSTTETLFTATRPGTPMPEPGEPPTLVVATKPGTPVPDPVDPNPMFVATKPEEKP
jgi:hypothetical protein